MDLVDLLQSDAADLPRVGEADIETQLRALFDAYLSEYARLSGADEATGLARHHEGAMRTLAGTVLDAVGAWLDGHPARALERLKDGLDTVGAALRENFSVPVSAAEIGPMFRIRSSDAPVMPSGIFHIPFDRRDLVRAQRYSFPGLPCLYLGRSTYICWVECGQEPLDRVWVSRFQLAPDAFVRVLDLARTPATTAAMLHNNLGNARCRGMAAAYAVLWPLIAACSLRRRPGSAGHFVPEYVLPQLLLRWLMEHGVKPSWAPEVRVEGLRYFSTRVNATDLDVAAFNYVFPTTTRSPAGVCTNLRAKFLVTPPVGWLDAVAKGGSPPSFNQVDITIHGVRIPYKHTDFAKVEGYLQSLKAVPLP